MKEVTMVFNVYRFEELNEEAKEVVKQWYLDGQDTNIFSDDLKSQLDVFFPNSDLNANYNLNCSQGDYVNINGNISLKDVLWFAEKEKLNQETYEYAHDFFTEEELSLLIGWFEEMETIKLSQVSYGVYEPACIMGIVDFLEEEKDYGKYVKHNLKFPIGIVKKFQRFFVDSLTALTNEFKEMGYNFFYEISDEDLQELCENNDYWFYENGKFYE